MLTIKSTPVLTFGPIKEFVVLKFLFFFVPQMLFLSLSNQGFAIFPVKVRNYIIKAFAMQKFCASLFRLINANISVNEQSEWFHGDTGGGHFIHTVRHVYILNHDHFTDIVSALAI
jgi:hypothetical protein